MIKDPIAVKFGENVRLFRAKLGKSQEELAFDSDLDRTFIGHIERGSRNVTLLTICKLAKALQTRPRDLVKDLESIPV